MKGLNRDFNLLSMRFGIIDGFNFKNQIRKENAL